MKFKFFNKEININTHLRDTIELFLANSKLSKMLSGQNRSIIFVRAITRKIIEYYDGSIYHRIDYPSGNLGYGFIHYAFITNIKPKRILCIGSRMGFIPAICSLACQENGFGEVDFVDAGYDESHPKHWGGIGFWKKNNPHEFFSYLGVNIHLKTYVMTSEQFANQYKSRYQYVYIDGDHSYKGVEKDYKLFWPRLDNGGLMIFHDVTLKKEDGMKLGVRKFWKEIKDRNKITFEFERSGLGIVQK